MSSYRGFSESSDSGRNYSSGAWGSGELDGAALAKKYNLDTSEQGRGDGHIWGRNADGSEVYIGKSNMEMASNEALIANHAKQANSGEVDHSSVPESLSSLGDIKGAILTEWAGGPAAPAAPEKNIPVVLSDRAAEAIAYTKAYENVMLPRQGDYTIKNDQSVVSDFQNDFKLNLARAKAPQPQEPQILQNAEAQATQSKVMNYANNYKKAVADTLVPNQNFF